MKNTNQCCDKCKKKSGFSPAGSNQLVCNCPCHTPNDREWKKVAELFHDTYETLAPAYGYETREDTKIFDPESKNGKLMTAVCKSVVFQLLTTEREKGYQEGLEEGDSGAYVNGIDDGKKIERERLAGELDRCLAVDGKTVRGIDMVDKVSNETLVKTVTHLYSLLNQNER